ncbi:uncharacterized protein LOC104878690 [Vitis vinifera]|uniref:uncharacterized protein LOC104878690 n=1 Tax=Vitis vinifera TaxID=29760 RepID=UPI00053FE9DD|nr:uncharacterized protein LOC104878690 [Vitis vinifera]|eukprot:XP_010647593.1 PREDICTED: uncharacterized protein LOC104878690 [Vitis vinifera]
MEDEAGWAKKMIQKDMLRIAASVIPIFLLLWTIQAGIKLATDPGNEAKYNQFALLIGVVTITFGTIYFIIGLGIVADLVLGWSGRLRGMEDKKTAVHQARETKTTQKDTGRLAATVITMFMLLWAIFTGFRLVTEPTRRDGRYSGLAFSIGVVAIVFGFVYFIIGLAILAELVLNILDELQKNERKESNIHIDCSIDV